MAAALNDLPDDGDPGGAGTRCDGVLISEVGVAVHQPGRSHQMASDPGGELLRHRLQLGDDCSVELLARDVLRDRGAVVLSLDLRSLGLGKLVSAPAAGRAMRLRSLLLSRGGASDRPRAGLLTSDVIVGRRRLIAAAGPADPCLSRCPPELAIFDRRMQVGPPTWAAPL